MQDHNNNNNGNNVYSNRVSYGMPSSVGALGVQPQRSLISMAAGSASGGGKGQVQGNGGGKMALSGRQMMLVKEDSSHVSSGPSHGSGGGGGHGSRGLGIGVGVGGSEGVGLEPVGENSQEYGGSVVDGSNHHITSTHPTQDGPVIGGAFSPSRGNSPNHNHPSQAMRGQPTHPRFQGTYKKIE